MKTLTPNNRQRDRSSFQKPILEEYKRAEALFNQQKNLKVIMCQKEFQRKMVLEGEEGNLVQVAVEILERGKEQTKKHYKLTHTERM